jgi:hypothetical protein
MALVDHASTPDKFYEFQIDEKAGTLKTKELFDTSCLDPGNNSRGFVGFKNYLV